MANVSVRAGVFAPSRSRNATIIRLAAVGSLGLPAMALAQQVGHTNAQEVQPGPGVFIPAAGNDRPPVANPMPPLNTIPPLPMPDPNAPAQGTALNDSMVFRNLLTGQTDVVPVQTVPGLIGGQGGGALPLEGLVGTEGFHPRSMSVAMYAVAARNAFPWSANCKVAERFSNGAGGGSWYVCSGTMIDANTCMAAGHCVYNHGNGLPDGFATDVYVFPGWDGNGNYLPPFGPGNDTSIANFGYGHSTSLAAGGSWVSSSNLDQDYSFISLDRSVGAVSGWFGAAWGDSCATIQGRTYNNASYPAENPCGIAGLHTGLTMYYWYGGIDACPGNRIQINTTPGCFTAVWGGMSGSSMYYIDGSGNRFAHAVCSTSDRATFGLYCKLDQVGYNYLNSTFIPGARGAAFDLQALNCMIAPTSIQAGATTATENFLAYNGSNGSASGTWTYRVYLSTNDLLTSADTLLSIQNFSYSFGPLSAVRVNMVPVTIPVNTPPGTYWLGVVFDPATDGNSGNNATNSWDAVQITVLPAAPGNDLCASATNVGEGSFSGNTATANTDGTSSCGSGTGKDVWYRYTASATGTVNINTCGSSFDTVLTVYNGCGGAEIACNDDSYNGGNSACGSIFPSDLQSGFNLAVTAGAVYTIRVAGYNAASGTYLLSIIPIPPTNDNCASAIAITPGTYTGSTGFANTDGSASCGNSLSAPDVWYAITPATTGLARLDTCGSSYDTVLSVHTGCPGTLDNEIGCDDDDYWNYGPCPNTLQSTVNVPVQAGHTYYVRVAGYNGHNGAYTLHYNPIDPIINDTCDAAIPITYGAHAFNTTGATTDGPTEANCGFCCSDLQINQDIWYTLVAPCARTITIDTLGSPATLDTKLAVYANYCPTSNDTAVVCNDDYAPGSNVRSLVTLHPTTGTRYYIRVGGFTTNAGAGVINVSTCLADFNCDSHVTVADIFNFLTAWFANDPRADINNSGTINVTDIFNYLTLWFTGC